VLVTGASGFLGGAVCNLLRRAEAEVHGQGWRNPLPAGVRAWQARLPEQAEELLAEVQPEVVLHLASPVDLRREAGLYELLRPGILDASVAVAEGCARRGLRLLQVGTCEELAGGPVPFDPEAAPQPTSPYSALKAAATAWVLAAHRAHGLRATVVRPFRTFGPGDRASVVAQACQAALAGAPFPMTDGAQVREWNHVEAMAHGLLAAAAHPDAVGRSLNLGGGPRRSVATLVTRIFALAGADPDLVRLGALPRRPGEVDAFWGDHRATDALLGPLPHPDLDQALAGTLAWHRSLRRARGPDKAP